MKSRKWSADEKLAIVVEGLKGKRAVADIYREHQISQTLYYRWRDKFLEGGKQAIQIEILKKRRSCSRQGRDAEGG